MPRVLRGADFGSYTEIRSHRLPSADRGKWTLSPVNDYGKEAGESLKQCQPSPRGTSVQHLGGVDSGTVFVLPDVLC